MEGVTKPLSKGSFQSKVSEHPSLKSDGNQQTWLIPGVNRGFAVPLHRATLHRRKAEPHPGQKLLQWRYVTYGIQTWRKERALFFISLFYTLVKYCYTPEVILLGMECFTQDTKEKGSWDPSWGAELCYLGDRLPCRTWNGQRILQFNKWSHWLACWGKWISRTSADRSQSYLLKFEQLCRAFQGLMGKYPVTNENKVDCPLRTVRMVRGNYSNYFYTKHWQMRPAIHPQCSAHLPCLFTARKVSDAFPDFPAFQYFSKSLLNDKCILKPEVSFSCHNAKGNRNLQCASCKYTQSEEQF